MEENYISAGPQLREEEEEEEKKGFSFKNWIKPKIGYKMSWKRREKLSNQIIKKEGNLFKNEILKRKKTKLSEVTI